MSTLTIPTLARHRSGQMHMNTIISDPAAKIIKRNVNITM